MIPFNVANKITTACLKKDQNVITSIEDEYHEIAIMTAKRVSAKNCPILVNMHDWAIDQPNATRINASGTGGSNPPRSANESLSV
jgi:hypothetical protein